MSTEKTSTPTAEEHSVANPDAAAKAVTAVDPGCWCANRA